MKGVVVLMFLYAVCILYVQASTHNSSNKPSPPVPTPASTKDLAPTDPLLLISTLDGTLHAVSKSTGVVKWKLDEEPVLNVPMESTTTIKGPTFLPDPHDGSLYAYDPSSEGLTKLPFTIQELVQASPCKSSDGILYTGRKQDVWYAINPVTGIKRRVITTESTSDKCPGGSNEDMFIGRTEYKITMFDTKLNIMRWNVTFTDYSSHANEKVARSDVLHLASSADGFVMTIDRRTGQILWAQNYGYPVVAMYAWVPEGLQKVEMTSVAKETMTYLLKQADGKVSWDAIFANPRFHPKEATLVPALYVGQYQHGLYALPAMTHDDVKLNVYRNVHMLPGPNEQGQHGQRHSQLEISSTTTPIWRLLGYHKTPPQSKLNLPKTHETLRGRSQLLEHDVPDQLRFPVSSQTKEIAYQPPQISPVAPEIEDTTSSTANFNNGSEVDNSQIHWNEITIVAILTSLITGFMFLILLKKYNMSSNPSHPKHYDALLHVGQISFNPVDILGRGSSGTVVYRGQFDGRRVAVKRVVRDCFSLADREVALLRESDEHPHVIRYFCMERDTQFQYISLELCSNTLQELVENCQYRSSTGLDTQTVLHQAMKGLDHLHRLKIVHRDVKPSNILISEPSKLGMQRVVISDFGLCKKLNPGRISVSLKSGTAGTDGWIAPEMILDKRDRITQAVDIFSMGCVFYYVICGKHPFGDPLSRQARIVAADYSLDELQHYEFVEEAADVIKAMLQTEPNARPKTDTILLHPLFWDSVKKLQFFEDVSDRVEKESFDNLAMLQLERDSLNDISNAIPRDWVKYLCRPLQDDLHKFRAYKTESVRDLLRAIRNKKHHYRELPEEVKLSLGAVPDDFLKYFTSRFPRLLVHSYRSIACCRREQVFQPYYGENAPDHLFDSVDVSDVTIFTKPTLNDRFVKKANKPNLYVGDSPPNKSGRLVKSKSAADQDLDWRSASTRPSVQNSPPSTAFKSLYKNTPSRVHVSSTYPALKPNRQNDEYENSDRRDSFGNLISDYEGSYSDLRPQGAARMRRLRNTSPRISECSSVGSDNDLARTIKPQRDVNTIKVVNKGVTNSSVNEEVHVTTEEEKLSTPQEEQRRVSFQDAEFITFAPQKNDSIPCTNSFTSLLVDDVSDEYSPDFETSATISTTLEEVDSSIIEETTEVIPEDDDTAEIEEKSPKKAKTKPRRRRLKKNKKPGAPLSEMSENLVETAPVE